jgi:hypothetical protein
LISVRGAIQYDTLYVACFLMTSPVLLWQKSRKPLAAGIMPQPAILLSENAICSYSLRPTSVHLSRTL